MDLIAGRGHLTAHEIFDFTESNPLPAMRIHDFKYRFIEQPSSWIGKKSHPDASVLVNLRLVPFEKATWPTGNENLRFFPIA
jgi:hypothetical protein